MRATTFCLILFAFYTLFALYNVLKKTPGALVRLVLCCIALGLYLFYVFRLRTIVGGSAYKDAIIAAALFAAAILLSSKDS